MSGAIDLLSGNVGSLPGRVQSYRAERFLGAGNADGATRIDWYFSDLALRAHASEFRRQFRVDPRTFAYLEQRLANVLQPSERSFRPDTIQLRDRIAVPLSVLGTRQDSAGVAVNTFGLGVSTVNHLVDQFTAAVTTTLRDELISLPDSVEEFNRIASALSVNAVCLDASGQRMVSISWRAEVLITRMRSCVLRLVPNCFSAKCSIRFDEII